MPYGVGDDGEDRVHGEREGGGPAPRAPAAARGPRGRRLVRVDGVARGLRRG